MFAEERQQLVARWVTETGSVSVTELAERFAVTTETIRRDLAALETAGQLRRVHGGAVPAGQVSTTESSLQDRKVQRWPEKQRLAAAAAALIPAGDGGSIVLDAGSSTEALARLLAAGSAPGPLIITNALPIADALASSPHLPVHLLGGRIREITRAAVGPGTIDAVSGLRPDIAFLGANGVHADFGLSTPDPEEAAVKRAFVRSARRVVVLADSSKLGGEALVRFARLDDVDTLVTDREPEAGLATALADAGVETVIA